jgi:hypothetical protein
MTPLPKPTPRFKLHGRVQAVSKSTPAQLRKEASELCARIVKRRDRSCRLKDQVPDVPCWGPLDAAHFWTKRSRPAARFNPEAILAACRQHHQWGHANETAWLALLRDLVGAARFAQLEAASLSTAAKYDLAAQVEWLRREAA